MLLNDSIALDIQICGTNSIREDQCHIRILEGSARAGPALGCLLSKRLENVYNRSVELFCPVNPKLITEPHLRLMVNWASIVYNHSTVKKRVAHFNVQLLGLLQERW